MASTTTREARKRANAAASRARRILWIVGAGIVGLVAFFGGVLPLIMSGIMEAIGAIALAAGFGFTAIAAWFRRNSDDKGERLLWFFVIVAGLGSVLFGLAGM